MDRSMPKSVSADVLADILKPGMVVYMPGCAGESPHLVAALRARPEAAAGVRFVGVYIPGANRVDYAGLHADARLTTIFLPPEFAGSYQRGAVDLMPMSYMQTYRYLGEALAVDAAVLHLSPPDADGACSLGMAADFTPAVWRRAGLRIAHINPAMVRPHDGPTVPFDALDYVIEADGPLLQVPRAQVSPAYQALAGHIVELVRDGDTLQFGLGQVQAAVIGALTGHRRLKIHSGMISDPLLELMDAGCLAPGPSVTCGVALGTDRLYDALAGDDRYRFAPVGHTHHIATLAAIDDLVAINGAIEVDLTGQVNAEFIGARQVSGGGGIADFLRGAQYSTGGRGIVALTATARGGTVSRVVPRLSGAAVTLARNDVDYIVTEYGAARLRGRTVDERAQALMAIAAPAFRDGLADGWRAMRREMA